MPPGRRVAGSLRSDGGPTSGGITCLSIASSLRCCWTCSCLASPSATQPGPLPQLSPARCAATAARPAAASPACRSPRACAAAGPAAAWRRPAPPSPGRCPSCRWLVAQRRRPDQRRHHLLVDRLELALLLDLQLLGVAQRHPARAAAPAVAGSLRSDGGPTSGGITCLSIASSLRCCWTCSCLASPSATQPGPLPQLS